MQEDHAAARTLVGEDELRALSSQGIVKSFPKNTVIVSEGDETDSFYIVDKIDSNFSKASRNIPNVTVTDVATLNTYDCLRARRIFITKEALTQLTARIKEGGEN